MKKIYTIMTFSKLDCSPGGFPDFGPTNLWGWYKSKKDAFEAVTSNACDSWETCYDYALIEEVEEGLYPGSHIRWFFEYDKSKDKYESINEPEFLQHFSGFTI